MIVRLLSYAPPLHWQAMHAFYAFRAIPGVESATGDSYCRVLGTGDETFRITVAHRPAELALALSVASENPMHADEAERCVRFAFDLDTDTTTIEGQLRDAEPGLAHLLALRPGLRPPGGWSGFELAVRAILGQQITVSGARTLAARLVMLCGNGVADAGSDDLPAQAFPSPQALLQADLSLLPMPGARRRTLQTVAHAVIEQPALLAPGQTLAAALDAWCSIPGIGPWTAHYIALRALQVADAFPASDAGLLRAARSLGLAHDARSLEARSARWRPLRAFMAQHLWCSDMA
ncbi:MAG: DNA-3-methyladenine glycosylase 2 family protein [Gammaproteobacteria bacterium]|nr:DNA-3-methyladenine glycosylase 2 family protein [Gammaproteobacteria bacterium]